MVEVTLPYEFVGGTKAIANQVNANFEAVTRGFTGVNVALEELRAEVDKFNNKPLRDSFDIIVSLVGATPIGAYPLWTGEWIYNARSIYKDFWAKALEYKKGLKIRTLTTAEYDAEVETYGETGAFVVDELNGHIRLPKVIRFISGLSDLSDLGKPFHDSFPDHSHRVYQNNGTYGASSSIFQSLGPLTNPGAAKGVFSTSGVNNDSGSLKMGVETAPKHIKCALFIQVANNTAEISAMDTAVIAEALSDAIDAIEAKSTEATADVAELSAEKVNLLNQTTTTNVGYIETAGSEQSAAVTAEGSKQVGLVTAAGSNLVAAGDEQVARVTAVGDEKVTAATNAAEAAATSATAAAASESLVADSAAAAALSAANAATSETEAAALAAAAQTSAENASVSATAASTSQTAAAESASAAVNSAAQAAASAVEAANSSAAAAGSVVQAENWSIGDLAVLPPKGRPNIGAEQAENNVKGQELVLDLGTKTGAVSLETNNIYKMVCGGAINFVLPASVNNAIHNQIKVMVHMPAVYAVDWGTNGRYFNNEAPDISETGKL